MNATLFVNQAQFEAITACWQNEENYLATLGGDANEEESHWVLTRLHEGYTAILGDAQVIEIIAQHPDMKIVVDAAARFVTAQGEQVWPN